MATTYDAAIDEMFGVVKGVLAGQVILGYVPDTRWPGVPLGTKPDATRLWVRVSAKVITDNQATLANANGKTLYEATGMLYIQLFCPRNIGASIDNGRLVAKAIQSAFRTSLSAEIWYTKAKIEELPESDESYPINVSVQFYYKTIS